MSRQYYSVRTGKNKNFSMFSLNILKKLFLVIYNDLKANGYFQEYFGYDCVDFGHVEGSLGINIDGQIYSLLRKDGLWPVESRIKKYTEDDLFDMIEFLYDHVSYPIETPGAYHSWNDCGWHYSKFDRISGQKKFLKRINEILADYSTGFVMNPDGVILVKEMGGLGRIHEAAIPTDSNRIRSKVELASQKYLQSRSNLEERRIAIRELADILEELRTEAKSYLLSKDESDLFNIANNYFIRHSNAKQKGNYDKDIWYSWTFYLYLSTIHALLRIKKRQEAKIKDKSVQDLVEALQKADEE